MSTEPLDAGADDADREGRRRLLARARRWVSPRLGIDARALAAFRIALGLLVLADLAMRSRDIVAFYTDAGVLPRAALAELPAGYAALSLHAVHGAAWFQGVLFAVAGAFAAALVVGYRTRIATFGSLVLTASLYARNVYVLNGGDKLLVVFVLLGLLLPLGERWSVDAARRDRPPAGRVTSVASAVLLSHLVVVYLTNAAFKLRGDRWTAGDAVRYVFSLDRFTVLAGDFLAGFPELLVLVNWTWLALLVGSVLLVLATGRARTALVAIYVSAHLGMALTLRLGLFPLVVVAGLLCFLPREVWDAVERRAGSALPTDRDHDRLGPPAGALVPSRRVGRRLWPRSLAVRWRVPQPTPRPRLPAAGRWGTRVGSAVAAGLLVLALVSQAAALGYVDAPDRGRAAVDLADYSWTLFAPDPPTVDGWYVVPAELASGERVDALRRSAVEWDRPPDVADAYPSTLWHRYLSEVRHGGETERRYLAASLCSRGADHFGEPVESLAIYYVAQPTRLDGPESTERIELYRHSCSGRGAAG